MRHASWSVVDENEKEELIHRVRKNHLRTATSQLSCAYNVFHYKLHLKYLGYATHEESLANGEALVEQPVWEWLCTRWGSDSFKMVQKMNAKEAEVRTGDVVWFHGYERVYARL